MVSTRPSKCRLLRSSLGVNLFGSLLIRATDAVGESEDSLRLLLRLGYSGDSALGRTFVAASNHPLVRLVGGTLPGSLPVACLVLFTVLGEGIKVRL